MQRAYQDVALDLDLRLRQLLRKAPETRPAWRGDPNPSDGQLSAMMEATMRADPAYLAKPLFAVDVLLTNKDLHAIGARVIPEMLGKQRVDGGVRSLMRTGLRSAISLLTGKLAGNFEKLRLGPRFQRQKRR